MAHLKIRHREAIGFSGGKYHDDAALADVLNYVLNPAKTPSGYVGGIAVDHRNALHEMEAVSRYNAQNTGVRLRHMILSFGKNELARSKTVSSSIAYGLAYEVAQFYGGRHQIVFAVHENGSRVHIHFVMNATNFLTGQKYDGSRADLYQFLNHINAILAPLGTSVSYLPDDEGSLIPGRDF